MIARWSPEGDGPGIAETERSRLQATTSSQDYESNTGLGLMLADLVARAHGGRLTLKPSESGRAVSLSIKVPAAPTA